MRFVPLLIVLVGCAPEFQVLERVYDLQAPRGAPSEVPLPLVILLHGYSASGWAQTVITPFDQIVDDEQVLLALPNGTVNGQGKRFWNATDYCCDFEHTGVDDVAFLRALIDDVKSRRAVSQVFVAGHSNGGFMALRLACEASDVIDGVASLAGATWLEEGHCTGGRVVPVLLVHGTADETIHYEGQAGRYPSAPETFRRFERRGGCDASTTVERPLDFLGDAQPETTAAAPTCSERAVELWTMTDVGHVPSFDERWPSAVVQWLREKSR